MHIVSPVGSSIVQFPPPLFLVVAIPKLPLLWRKALQKEAAYFRDHPAYKGLDKRVGTTNLSKTLNQVTHRVVH